MSNTDVLKLLQRASAQLKFANKELCRPSEDVVSFCICSQAKCSIADLLSSFLLMKGIDISHAENLEQLRKMCSEINENFSKLDFSGMDCHPTKIPLEEHYCMGIERVKECLKIANQVKEVVWNFYRNERRKYLN